VVDYFRDLVLFKYFYGRSVGFYKDGGTIRLHEWRNYVTLAYT